MLKMILKHFLCGMFVLYGAFVLVSPIRASVDQLTFYRDTAYDDLLPKAANVTSSALTETEIECAKLCMDDGWCNSFFYNDVKRKCLRQRVVFMAPPPNLVNEEPGWYYFQLESKAMCPADKSYIADRLTGTCYRVDLSRKNWTAARDACAANGERLVVLEPVVKAQFFADFFKANKGLFYNNQYNIGAERSGANATSGPEFDWLDGVPVNITATELFWVPGKPLYRPKRDILVIKSYFNFRWTEAEGKWKRRSICEHPFLSN